MNKIELIVVEDDLGEQQVVRDTAYAYEIDRDRTVGLTFYDNVEEAVANINGNFDGVILDMKLHNDQEGGSKILAEMEKASFRVPVVFVTSYPSLVNQSAIVLRTRVRGEETYREDFDLFFDLYNTGLTKIMGGRGTIEDTLKMVFAKNIMNPPQLAAWIQYGKADPARTEKALLRFTLNHLMQLLEDDEADCFPEEVYLYPPLYEGLKSGSIVKQKEGDGLRIILNPACDLVVRASGQFNTDKILLIEIDDGPKVYEHVLKKIECVEEKRDKMQAILKNRHTLYHHWLPRTNFFPGGFINFRKLTALSKKEFLHQYNRPHIQVSPNFVKDILSRFSSYYARQGQPDIDNSGFVSEVVPMAE